jgi:glycosyltransferase involved in cell wall biosynthesis
MNSARGLHVLTITPFYPSADNEAAGCFIAEPLRALEQVNVTSTVIAVSPVYRVQKQAHASAPAEWLRYPQLPGNLGLSTAGRFLSARLLGHVKLLHEKRPFDVIHAHAALPCGHAAALLSAKLGIPFVVTVHGLDVFNSCYENSFAARGRKKVSAAVYRKAGRVICISEKVRKLIVDGMNERIHSSVVYNGTDTQLFSPASEPSAQSEQTILVVGNLILLKGHELVFRAIARLKDRYPNLQCRVIGEGPDRELLVSLTKELGIAHQVKFLGRKDRAAVAEEMRNCTIFALPSRYEALGCVYLEAMSSAKPVIACRGQGIDEIIRHKENGWLIPVDDLDALVEGFSALLDSQELRQQIGQRARKTIVKSLTLLHQAQHLADLYRGVAAQNSL